jgi:hypothetical protein
MKMFVEIPVMQCFVSSGTSSFEYNFLEAPLCNASANKLVQVNIGLLAPDRIYYRPVQILGLTVSTDSSTG